jgi:nucleotide-binding universal stress UspA family protein
MTRILLAVADSATSVAAARRALRLFGESADYTVINVADDAPVIWGDDALRYGLVYSLALPGAGVVGGLPFTVRQPSGTSESAPHDERIDVAAQTAEDIVGDVGLTNVESVGDVGDPAAAIISAASECGADVIVVGAHQRGWFSRLRNPSVSGAVIRNAEVPVLVAG